MYVQYFLLCVIGVFLALTLYWGIKLLLTKGKVCSTTGSIIDIDKTAGYHYLSQKRAKMTYRVDGKNFTSDNRITVSPMSKIGDGLAVKYYIDQPTKLFTLTNLQFGVLLGVTIICMILYFLNYIM